MSTLIKRQDAFDFFSESKPGNASQTAAALGISRATISQNWDEVLSLELSDKLRGACVRLGKRIPPQFMSDQFEKRQARKAAREAVPVWNRPLRKKPVVE